MVLKRLRDHPYQGDRLYLVIDRNRWISLELRDLWAHRDLFYFLAWRDVKVRYKQTVLGAAWAILQPLITMVVFTLLFGRLARVPSEGEPYAIFSYAGLLPWNFFTAAVTNSSNSLVGTPTSSQKSISRLLVFPPRQWRGLGGYSDRFANAVCDYAHLWVGFHASLFLLIPLVALTALTASAVGIWTSALNVKYRDIRYALPFAIQIRCF